MRPLFLLFLPSFLLISFPFLFSRHAIGVLGNGVSLLWDMARPVLLQSLLRKALVDHLVVVGFFFHGHANRAL